MKIPFIGQSYVYRSINFSDQRLVNFYPVKSEVQGTKNIDGLQATAGLKTFSTLGLGSIRGSIQTKGRVFVVSGTGFYEIFADGSFTKHGDTELFGNPVVGMSSNGREVIVVEGANGYIFDMNSNGFNLITADGWRGSNTVAFIDGYFVLVEPNTGIYYISGLFAGSNYDPTEFASAEGSPDDLVAVATVHKELWLFGTDTIQISYNSGAAQFPFDPIQGAFIEYGCAAPHTVAVSANTVFWLGSGQQGDGVVWMATGYNPQRISTFAIETAISSYGDISDATSYTYEEDGHYFYCLNFPSAGTTWCFDINLNAWHEKAYWNKDTGQYERHRADNHVFAFGKHLMGDYANGKIYHQSLSILDDDGDVIRRIRQSPTIFDEVDLNYIYYTRFQLDMETGVGNDTDANPKVWLEWSDDGGHTWSNQHIREAGKVGKYKHRAIWRALGRGRDRVWRVGTTAKVKLMLIGAYIGAEKGSN